MNIVESITKNGIKITPPDLITVRFQRPKNGDILLLPDGDTAMMVDVGKWDAARLSFIRTKNIYGGSSNMTDNGVANPSGGPFEGCFLENIEPMFTVHPVSFWTWSNAGAGGDMGAHFKIDRPVFRLKTSTKSNEVQS
jgi:hypothetical protein